MAQIAEDLARALGAAPDGCIIAWDASAPPLIVFATGNVEAVFQAKAGSLLGQPVGSLFAGGERAAKDLAVASANVPIAEQRPMLRNGKPFAAQLLLRGVQGGAVAFVRDLAASHGQADATLRAEDLARFASLVAHEVRNPLSAVKIALQTLERHGTLAQNDLRRTSIALREVLNIELLLNEVLEFARPPSLSLVPADPRPAVEEAVAGVEAEWAARGVTFTRTQPERMSPAALDPVRIRRDVRRHWGRGFPSGRRGSAGGDRPRHASARCLRDRSDPRAEEAGGGSARVDDHRAPRHGEHHPRHEGRRLRLHPQADRHPGLRCRARSGLGGPPAFEGDRLPLGGGWRRVQDGRHRRHLAVDAAAVQGRGPRRGLARDRAHPR